MVLSLRLWEMTFWGCRILFGETSDMFHPMLIFLIASVGKKNSAIARSEVSPLVLGKTCGMRARDVFVQLNVWWMCLLRANIESTKELQIENCSIFQTALFRAEHNMLSLWKRGARKCVDHRGRRRLWLLAGIRQAIPTEASWNFLSCG